MALYKGKSYDPGDLREVRKIFDADGGEIGNLVDNNTPVDAGEATYLAQQKTLDASRRPRRWGVEEQKIDFKHPHFVRGERQR